MKPFGFAQRRRLGNRSWLLKLAGTCLAATAAGPTMMTGGIAVAAPALIFALGPSEAFSPQPVILAGPPTGLTAAGGNSEVTLAWKLPESASAATFDYYVYEGTSSGGESAQPINDSPVTGLGYKATGLTNGTAYYFEVAAAIGRHLVSDKSAEVSAIPATTPGAPTGLTATAGSSQVTLSWAAPASDGGSRVTSYNVYDGTTADFTGGAAVKSSTSTSATVTSLTNGMPYYFVVTAVNAAGEGRASREAPATPAAPPVSPPPVSPPPVSPPPVSPPSPSTLPVLVILLAAVMVAAGAVITVLRSQRVRRRPPLAPASDVRAVPDAGPPALVSVHDTGPGVTHTVRIEPNAGPPITTIKECRP